MISWACRRCVWKGASIVENHLSWEIAGDITVNDCHTSQLGAATQIAVEVT